MNVVFQKLNGETLTMDVHGQDTVKEVAQELEAITNENIDPDDAPSSGS